MNVEHLANASRDVSRPWDICIPSYEIVDEFCNGFKLFKLKLDAMFVWGKRKCVVTSIVLEFGVFTNILVFLESCMLSYLGIESINI